MSNKKYWFFRFCDTLINDDDFQALLHTPNGKVYGFLLLRLYLIAINNENGYGTNVIVIPSPNARVFNTRMAAIADMLDCNMQELELTISLAEEYELIKVFHDETNRYIECLKLKNYVGHSTYEADRKREQRLEQLDGNEKLLAPKKKHQLGKHENVYLTDEELEELEKNPDFKIYLEKRSVMKVINDDNKNDYESIKEMMK